MNNYRIIKYEGKYAVQYKWWGFWVYFKDIRRINFPALFKSLTTAKKALEEFKDEKKDKGKIVYEE